MADIVIKPVDSDNWRAVAALGVKQAQYAFVAQPSYYLTLCCYDTWHPLAVCLDEKVIGFLMWGIDEDESCWLGGILLDQAFQGQGYGRKTVQAAMTYLKNQKGVSEFALSYEPENEIARQLYASLGFVETGELEGAEIVARLRD